MWTSDAAMGWKPASSPESGEVPTKAAPSRNTSACQSAERRTLPANSPSSSGSGGKRSIGVADADNHSHWSRAPHPA